MSCAFVLSFVQCVEFGRSSSKAHFLRWHQQFVTGYRTRARRARFDSIITEELNDRQRRKSGMNGTFDIELEQALPFLGVSRNLFHRIGGDTANSICLMFFTKISIKSTTCFRFVGHSCYSAFSCPGPFAYTIWTQIAHRWSLGGYCAASVEFVSNGRYLALDCGINVREVHFAMPSTYGSSTDTLKS